MAKCPECNSEISFLAVFTLGGSFKCNSCQAVIHKKINNEMIMVFPCILTGLLTAFAATVWLKETTLSDINLYLVAAIIALLAALFIVKLIWSYFIKL